jgi:NIMA (never in mitosis gene a)-related kinase
MKAKYKIIKALGEGSFGKAYLASVDNDEKKYVIKQVLIQGLTDKEKKETLNEAIILKKLDHPNIIKFKEVFIQRKPIEALNIVTEYADGGDLEQKIKGQNKKPFTEEEILDYFTQICLALQHLHKKKIIHRDLKSGNVFLMKSGIVKLGDFGISKGLKSSRDKAVTMVGTPFYLSPEIILNKPYDAKSDIWALGVLLYELLTFKMPFNAKSLPTLSIKINKGEYTPPSSKYSSEIRDLLKRCLTLKPEERPSIDEILKLPLIKNRINNLLNEVQYDQDLSKTMVKKYKDKKKEDEKHHHHHHHEEKKEEENKKPAQEKSENKTAKEPKKEESNKEKKMVNDKDRVFNTLKKKKKKVESNPQVPGDKKTFTSESSSSTSTSTSTHISTDKSLSKTNFLMHKKDPNFQKDKQYKEDEIGKTLNARGYKDLLDDKNGNFDINKMNEDQYNQLRLLNNLHKVANNQEQDSDSEISVTSSIASLPSSKSLDDFIFEDGIQGTAKESKKEVASKETIEKCKEENNEIDKMKKNIEKEIGSDFLKEILGMMEKTCGKDQINFDRELIKKNILEFTSKGFDKAKAEKAVEKIEELFGIFMKDKILV